MTSRQIKILIFTIAILVLGAVAVSQTVKRVHYWHSHGMYGGRMLAFFSDYLDLTDAQKAQAKEILAKEKPALQPLFQQLAQGHHQMRQLEENGNFDETQVRTLATQQSQTMTELLVQKARIESELLQILTPDQKTKFKAFMDKREKRFAEHMQEEQSQSDTNQEKQ
jgi:periplasmic protein CpxP/Spy